jgi:hypothetical protein
VKSSVLYTVIPQVDMVLTLLVREGELVRIYLHSCMTCRGLPRANGEFRTLGT